MSAGTLDTAAVSDAGKPRAGARSGSADGLSVSPASGSGAGIAATVARLRATFASGRTKPVAWRLAQLEAIERLVTENEPAIAKALDADLGRPPFDAWLGDVGSTAKEASFAAKNLLEWMQPVKTGLPVAQQPAKAFYQYEPPGVVLVISPWNYPVYLGLGPVIGAVAAGDCAVLKPSEHAPATSKLLAELVPAYLDPDAVAVVEGEADATQELIAQGFDHIFFTGGPEIAKHILAGAAPHLTPVTLELGGKSPAIVTRAANLTVTARRLVWTKLLNSGQTCIAPDYVLVERDVRDALVSEITAAIAEQRKGSPRFLRIVNDRQFGRLERLLAQHGGTVAVGGATEKTTHSIEPTVVVDPDPASDLMQEEIFGPLLPVLSVDSLAEAVTFVNGREKPLAAYLFSDDKAEQETFLADIPAGGMVVNHAEMHCLVPQLPFGGVGNSGMGAYHGEWGFQTFSHRKAVLVKSSKGDLPLLYPPYPRVVQKLLRKVF